MAELARSSHQKGEEVEEQKKNRQRLIRFVWFLGGSDGAAYDQISCQKELQIVNNWIASLAQIQVKAGVML